MHPKAKQIIDKINKKIDNNNNNFFYIAHEAERALGLEKLIKNYQVVCFEPDHIANSVNALVVREKKNARQFINETTLIKKGDMIQTFNHFPCTYKIASNKRYKILNPIPKIAKSIEDKFFLPKFLENINIRTPYYKITDLNESAIKNFSSEKIVIQLQKGHTGNSTFIPQSDQELKLLLDQYKGSLVKISKFIEGIPLTINGCITNKGIFISGLQYQITGMTDTFTGKGVSIGNDWGIGNIYKNEYGKQIFDIVSKIGQSMRKMGFFGLFGVDLIVNDDIHVIEINARQTGNIPMQTKLEILNDHIPLILLHISHFLNIEIDLSPENEILPLNGSQIFIRAKEKISIKNSIKSGIYRLQSDNSAIIWENGKPKQFKPDVFFIDEERDMPLIYQNDGYSIEDIINGGFFLFCKPKGLTKEATNELARMQFLESIVQNDLTIKPWVSKAIKKIENYIL
jgi:predicted ATP-grasp superfamily ATP-dependent carboligase